MQRHKIRISSISETVSACTLIPDGAHNLLVLAHGAGAPMDHKDMTAYANALAEKNIATMRFNFPFAEQGRKRPDRPEIAKSVITEVIQFAESEFPGHAVYAGGKSFGGRMTSHCAAEKMINVRGLVFFGFPLHAPGKPSTDRAAHLADIKIPMLFLQGTRDSLAKEELIRGVCLPIRNAELYIVKEGDHSLHVTKRSGRTFEQALEEVSNKVASWMAHK